MMSGRLVMAVSGRVSEHINGAAGQIDEPIFGDAGAGQFDLLVETERASLCFRGQLYRRAGALIADAALTGATVSSLCPRALWSSEPARQEGHQHGGEQCVEPDG